MPDDRTDIDHTGDIDPEIEALLAELGPDDLEPVAPPASIWAAIERELADDPVGPVTTDTHDDAPGGNRLAGTVVAGEAAVVPFRSRRRSMPMYLAAAAAVVLVVVGVVAVIGGGSDPTLVAATRLDHDPAAFDPLGADATATARLVERGGIYEIELDDTSFPDVDTADLELWLIEADADGTIVDVAPVALLDGSDRYAVPSTIDVSTHTIVDISIEPRDGDETHSGRSILRGVLPSA